MVDERVKKLCHTLVNYSCRVKKGDNVLIDVTGCDDALVQQLIKETYAAGGNPYTTMPHAAVTREWLMQASREQIENITKWDSARMKEMQAYIAFRGGMNATEMGDVPPDKMEMYQSIYSKEVHHNLRVKNTNWVVLRYPTPSMAQQASMSTEAFEDFYFKVCNLDYAKMSKEMDALLDYYARTDKVHITGPGTDITFSIKDIGAKKCAGHFNVPDGEVYTAPVRDSVNGRITYNTPSINRGFKFENVSLNFKDGKIIEATANDTKRVNEIFDTDEGARYVGEFSLGINPHITRSMGDILFDEKIAGSLHFTPGSAYDDAYNGNESAVHWDLVLVQTPEMGGGEIYFDDVLVRKDGIFVAEELKGLNPDNLK
ncbi:aminopeptidase [Christensenellaceae bacterium OttesenSCG-928-K19]|nr:aminopeptidase [Christensenellaceae bacterium OttesenSCG-928-K19]